MSVRTRVCGGPARIYQGVSGHGNGAVRESEAIPRAGNGTRRGRRSGTATSVDNFNRYAEHISRAALGKDVARVRWIGLELVP